MQNVLRWRLFKRVQAWHGLDGKVAEEMALVLSNGRSEQGLYSEPLTQLGTRAKLAHQLAICGSVHKQRLDGWKPAITKGQTFSHCPRLASHLGWAGQGMGPGGRPGQKAAA